MGSGMAAARKQKIWLEEIPFWADIYRKLQRGDKAYAAELMAFLKPMSKCPASVLEELNELVNEDETSWLTLEQFLLITTSGRPATVRQRRFHRVVTAAANVYAGKLQRARVVRLAMVDYPLFLLQVLFFVLISVAQVVTYFQYLHWCCPSSAKEVEDYLRFVDKLVLAVERKREFWRNVSFVLVSYNGLSLVASVVIQMLFCLPVSFLHSPWKIPFIYVAGAFAAAQLNVICGYCFTLGASAALYSVVWAHVVDVLVNRSQFGRVVGRVAMVLLFTAADAVQVYYLNRLQSIGTLPHLIGVVVGCTMGIVILRKNRGQKWEKWVYGIIKYLHWAVIVLSLWQATRGSTY
ncbi:protein rhomboid-like [Dermacentor albipictus]|uniref:protein rhomboid-like n=1 Tax=Dermacentor albipictus TaxID=60249 RepID=UPI0031FD9B25